jgi:hypothetical protein
MEMYNEAAAASNITVPKHKVTFDPEVSWLKFHLGINRYSLYSRQDPAVGQLLRDMHDLTIISAGAAGKNAHRWTGNQTDRKTNRI